jgi:A/G-specific adenine glycosylase
MLQQTRVAAVLEHYKRFLKRFPTVARLAAASEADVLAEWSGLGYYRRARMLQRAARTVHADYAGRLPGSATDLRKLPGIGRYTANAIASIAFGEPVAVVDGNVERVLTRVLGKQVGGEALWTSATDFLDREEPGDFNQAMMELGATLCVPGVPLCGRCPIQRSCASRGMKRAAKALPGQRSRKSAYLALARRGESVLLRQRPQMESLMPGMWELPRARRELRSKAVLEVKHSITTTDWRVSVFPASRMRAGSELQWFSLNEAQRLPLTGLTRKILYRLKLLA